MLPDWSRHLFRLKRNAVEGQLDSPGSRPRLLAASTPESAALFTAPQSTNEGTRLPEAHFSIAVGLQLGLPVAAAGRCSCGEMLDAFVDYALSCEIRVSREGRHSELNARILSAFQETGCPAILEPEGLVQGDGVRPDGLTVLAFERGRQVA